jgi:hypothetical protein
MTKTECESLVKGYLGWLRQGLAATEVEGGCLIETPFLDRHNDAIEVFFEHHGELLRLSDDGYTLRDLRTSGMEFSTEKRKSHLRSVLNGFGVTLEGDTLSVQGSAHELPQKKHNLIQAILAIGDMFVMAEEHVLSLFKEDVAAFLDSHAVHRFSDFKLSGKSGLDHKFDFGVARSSKRPERVIQAINQLTKDTATSLAFSVSDVRAAREVPLGAVAFVNDSAQAPGQEYISVLRAYEIEPVLWSGRDTALHLLNGVGG